MHSKVSSDWLPSYLKTTRPVLEIFKMSVYFPDSHSIHQFVRKYMEEEMACVGDLMKRTGFSGQKTSRNKIT
jgi:hypothetical protein